jgi:glyoxalase family protein
MPLEGLHHVTAITGDAPANVDFYARVMGLRLVKKTVNFDQPDVYHLYFGDEQGTPGSILTFFEFPGVAPGRAGDGMVHTVQWRVGRPRALDFWAERLSGEGVAVAARQDELLAFADPEGLRHELLAVAVPDAPLVARAPDVPAEHALRGFHGVRAYASRAAASGRLLEALGFEQLDESGADWRVAGAERQATLRYDVPPRERGEQAGGTVHHIAAPARLPSSTASTSTRSTSASPAACSSSWRRATSASPTTSRSSRWASRSSCRPSTRPTAPSSSGA